MKLKTFSLQVALSLASMSIACAANAGFLSDLFGPEKEPTVLPLTTTQILQNEVWVVDGNKPSAYEVATEKTKKGTRYKFVQKQGTQGPVSSQIEGGSVVRNTGKVLVTKPIGVTFLKNGDAQFSFGSAKAPVLINVQMKALDVSGQKMSDYLQVKGAKTNADADKAGSKKFPEGSVAYQSKITFVNGEMILPVNETFTNAKSSNELVENFSSVPYCLGYERREGARAFGVVFNGAQAKTKASSGTFELMPVRVDTIFCRTTGDKSVAKGTWNLVQTGHSSAVVLTIPKGIDARDFGIKQTESKSAQFAFIAPAKGDTVFRPGRYFAKGTELEGRRYLFNKTAADAIESALK